MKKSHFRMAKMKHSSDMALGEVKAVPRMAWRLMKGPQLSDNLFLVGLSVNHVDSISFHLTASGCASSSISPTSEAGERMKDGEVARKRRREVNNVQIFLTLTFLPVITVI